MEPGRRRLSRSLFALTLAVAAVLIVPLSASAQSADATLTPEGVLDARYSLVLNLVRHTATYSPPVASRAFAYFGVIGYEAIAGGRSDMATLAGQLNGLAPLPKRDSAAVYDDAVVLDAALSSATWQFFDHTGPTGQRAMKALDDKLSPAVAGAAPKDVAERSAAYGRALTEAVSAWAEGDGTGPIENMGFPLNYTLKPGPEHWKPTSAIAQQQAPLLPDWGKTRTFAMPNGASCDLPAPPPYSVDPSSQFYREAMEVDDAVDHLDAEQQGDRALLVGRPDAVDDAARPLDPDRLPVVRQDEPADRPPRRSARAAGRRHRRRLHRLLEHQVSLRSGAADHLHPR